jgi:predicted nucleic acid-binding protein
MGSLFVDTNVFLRFLTNDDPVKAKRVESLFRDALPAFRGSTSGICDRTAVVCFKRSRTY